MPHSTPPATPSSKTKIFLPPLDQKCPVKHQPNTIPLDAVTSYASTFKEHPSDFYPVRNTPSSFYSRMLHSILLHHTSPPTEHACFNTNCCAATKTTQGHYETTNSTSFVAPEPKHHEEVVCNVICVWCVVCCNSTNLRSTRKRWREQQHLIVAHVMTRNLNIPLLKDLITHGIRPLLLC